MATGGSFEVDKTSTGRIKINVVGIANLLALIGLLGTAIATWNGLTAKVDLLTVRLDSAVANMVQIRTDMNNSLLAREAESRDIRNRMETLGNRMTAVETIMKRVEENLLAHERLQQK